MMKRIVAGVMLILMLAVVCSGCGKKVEVYLDGGSLSESQMKDMETVVASTPVKEGYVFAGWYSDAEFSNYVTASSLSNEVVKNGEIYAKWIRVNTFTYQLRSNEATISDSGRHEQQVDIAYLSDNISIVDLKRAGYQNLEVTVTMEVPLAHQGRKIIYLYKNNNVVVPDKSVIGWLDQALFGKEEEEDKDMLHAERVAVMKSDSATKADDTCEWGVASLTTRVPIEKLEKDLYLRYDAGENTAWSNRKVTVTVTPIK